MARQRTCRMSASVNQCLRAGWVRTLPSWVCVRRASIAVNFRRLDMADNSGGNNVGQEGNDPTRGSASGSGQGITSSGTAGKQQSQSGSSSQQAAQSGSQGGQQSQQSGAMGQAGQRCGHKQRDERRFQRQLRRSQGSASTSRAATTLAAAISRPRPDAPASRARAPVRLTRNAVAPRAAKTATTARRHARVALRAGRAGAPDGA